MRRILFLLIVVLAVLVAGSLDAHHRRIRVKWVEEGTGVFRTEIIKEPGKEPVSIKKEITRRVKKYFDEYGNELRKEDIDSDDSEESSAADVPVMPINDIGNNLAEVFNKPGAGVSYGYYLLTSAYGTDFFAPGFAGSWNTNLTFEGYGWQAYLSFGEFTQFHPGVRFTIGAFTTNKVINSYVSGSGFARETLDSTIVLGKVDFYYHFIDMFYGSIGVGAYYQDFKTTIDSNLPAYLYAGLEGKTLTAAVSFGAGMKLPVTSNINLNLGGEILIFIAEKDQSVIGLRYGVVPMAGISAIW